MRSSDVFHPGEIITGGPMPIAPPPSPTSMVPTLWEHQSVPKIFVGTTVPTHLWEQSTLYNSTPCNRMPNNVQVNVG